METHRAPTGCILIPTSIAISAIVGTIVGAIVDGNGFFADDAYLIGLWCGFVAIGFSIVAFAQRTWTPYVLAVAAWIAATWLLEAISSGEGDGVFALMGGFGLISAVVCACVRVATRRPAGEL